MVESSSDEILGGAATSDIAFLVVGDPFGYITPPAFPRHLKRDLTCLFSYRATTHTDLVLRARSLNIPTQTVHNASIMSAIGCTGLQLYNFGQAVSMVFFTETWKPASFYDRLKENHSIGLHTLMLLDIKVKEQSLMNMARGRKIYEPPRFMTVAQCAGQMLEIEEEKKERVCGKRNLAVGVARVGARDQKMAAGTLEELSMVDLGEPLHSLVLLGRRTHYLERDFLRAYAIDRDIFDEAWNDLYEPKP